MDQGIIEKKPTSPLATSLLAISMCCMLGCMVMCGVQLRELKYKEVDIDKSAESHAAVAQREYKNLIKTRVKPKED